MKGFKGNSLGFYIALVGLGVIILGFELVSCHMVGNNPNRHRETLDPEGKYVLEWLVDWSRKSVTFNVTVETRGYVGFGLSPNGKMTGADIVIGGVTRKGKSYFSDRHAVGNHLPELDPSQDWKLHSAWESETHTNLVFSRDFDTCDPQDYAITEDKLSIIWSFGENDDQIEYHYQNRGVFHVHLLHPDFSPEIEMERMDVGMGWGSSHSQEGRGRSQPRLVGKGNNDVQVWTLNRNTTIPSQDTTYWCTIHAGPRLQQEHHIIGIDVRFDSEESRRHVHHLFVMKCTPPPGTTARSMFHPFLEHQGQQCFGVGDPPGPLPNTYCTEQLFVWGVGGRTFFLPPHMGIPVGSSPDEYYLFQVHYDNPQRQESMVDVNIDFFYTNQLRPNVGGMFTVLHSIPGEPPSLLLPPSTLSHSIYGMCPSECTERMMPKEGIHIVSAFLHSHNSGSRIRLHHFRDGKELEWVSKDDNYAFDYQPMKAFNEEVTILPGDQLALECVYDNTWTNGTVVGGLSTRQEMCMAFMYYYNKMQGYEGCASQIVDVMDARQQFLGIQNVTWNPSQLQYVVDAPHKLAGLTITQVSDNHVDWTIEKRKQLQRFTRLQPHVGLCSRMEYGRPNATDIFAQPTMYPTKIRPFQREPKCLLKH